MFNYKPYNRVNTTVSAVVTWLIIPLLGLVLAGCQTNGGTTDNLNSTIETFHVAPQTQKCTGPHRIEQECLIINGDEFHDNISGFDFDWGHEYELKVKKTLTCNPNVVNSCPQQYKIYDYELISVISKQPVDNLNTSPIQSLQTLQVTSLNSTEQGLEVDLISAKGDMQFKTVLNTSYMTGLGFRDKKPLMLSDYVKIDGVYLESYPVQIIDVERIIKVSHPH